MNILAIGAHFDDVELGCGGTLARHAARGDVVHVFVATVSGFSDQEHNAVRSNEDALAEAREATRILGVKELVCGGFKTLAVEFVDDLNVQILKILEERKIDLVYMHWTGDIHHDHQAVARASLHCCRHVPRLLMFQSNWYASTTEFRGNFYVDITEQWATKERALQAYVTEMQRTHGAWTAYFRNEAENAGRRIGVGRAEVFEVVKWLEI